MKWGVWNEETRARRTGLTGRHHVKRVEELTKKYDNISDKYETKRIGRFKQAKLNRLGLRADRHANKYLKSFARETAKNPDETIENKSKASEIRDAVRLERLKNKYQRDSNGPIIVGSPAALAISTFKREYAKRKLQEVGKQYNRLEQTLMRARNSLYDQIANDFGTRSLSELSIWHSIIDGMDDYTLAHTSVNELESYMTHSVLYNDNYLMHYGVKGMGWGKRNRETLMKYGLIAPDWGNIKKGVDDVVGTARKTGKELVDNAVNTSKATASEIRKQLEVVKDKAGNLVAQFNGRTFRGPDMASIIRQIQAGMNAAQGKVGDAANKARDKAIKLAGGVRNAAGSIIKTANDEISKRASDISNRLSNASDETKKKAKELLDNADSSINNLLSSFRKNGGSRKKIPKPRKVVKHFVTTDDKFLKHYYE